ncbi:hypothetical protein JRO89_XS01G0133100 [Xanthoceras sorbifolium]|uniref:RRM domain-containing protein n=1 Tax=Xanthoceras sorbifolium TaxID=99658 RepID=A0ABQ8IJY5_9ROSI|nr:hypothetical protein JRO89_XS01G0133100 [Xanthoceras sorbifolium]
MGGFDMICSGRDKIETPEQFKQAEETTVKLDLDGPEHKCFFGFDTACKIYAEVIGNVMVDARSTGKYYHFVRLMGRAASHITLECALQTHPNITIIGEEVQHLIEELNEILAHDVVVDEAGMWKKKLRSQSRELLSYSPKEFRSNYCLKEIHMGMCSYEGRCGLPTNFDSNYCYALGYAAGALLHSGKTGLISSVGNLGAPVEEWTVGGTALTALMDVERRQWKFKPVIKKAMVELEGAPFKKFASLREEWVFKNRYVRPVRLSWSLNEKSLKDAFSSYGEVTEVNIIYDRDSGRSRGFGFVHFSKEEDAVCAKDAMDGKALSGRPLRISFALERVRGEPVVVPRLRSTGDYSGRDT